MRKMTSIRLAALLLPCLLSMHLVADPTPQPKNPKPQQDSKKLAPSADLTKIDLPHGEADKLIEELKGKLPKMKIDVQEIQARRLKPQKQNDKKDAPPKDSEFTTSKLAEYLTKASIVAKSLNVEEDSKIDRKWFANIAETLNGMLSFRRNAENAAFDLNQKVLALNLAAYNKWMEGLENGLDKKDDYKLSKDKLKRIREENDKVRKKLREEAEKAERDTRRMGRQ